GREEETRAGAGSLAALGLHAHRGDAGADTVHDVGDGLRIGVQQRGVARSHGTHLAAAGAFARACIPPAARAYHRPWLTCSSSTKKSASASSAARPKATRSTNA